MSISIIFEGVDGSGKSTQVKALKDNLEKIGKKVSVRKWNDSAFVSDMLDRLCHTDYADTKIGAAIIACGAHAARVAHYEGDSHYDFVIYDRSVYTEFARESARGIDFMLLRAFYGEPPKADIVFFLDVDPRLCPDVLVTRKRNKTYSFFEAGLDMGLSGSLKDNYIAYKNGGIPRNIQETSFISFQKKVYVQYTMLREFSSFISIRAYEDCEKMASLILKRVFALYN